MIVVGSFKRKSYVNTMIARLQKLNLPYFTQSYKDFTRVGVEVDCNNEVELLDHLKNIKEKIESEAWILN